MCFAATGYDIMVTQAAKCQHRTSEVVFSPRTLAPGDLNKDTCGIKPSIVFDFSLARA